MNSLECSAASSDLSLIALHQFDALLQPQLTSA
jgi:hypothetical protein